MKIPIFANITGKSDVLATLQKNTRSAEESRLILTPGQEVRGDVLSRLEDGSYLVKVAGTVFDMEIPIPLEPGSPIQLTFRCSQPRPTFIMQSSPTDATSVSLSATSTLLTRSFAADEAAVPNASQPVPRILLQESASPDPRIMANALRNAVTFSGLFYESHLLQWYLGEIPFANILQEARSGLSHKMRRDQENTKEAINSDESGVNADETENNLLAALLSEHESDEESSVFSSKARMELVRDQLDLLRSGTFAWHGEAMAGHEMEWLVEREPDGADSDGSPSWRTSIRISLPNLGLVCATLTLAREGIEGIVRSKLPETAAILRKEIGILEERLDDAGIRLNGMVIENGK